MTLIVQFNSFANDPSSSVGVVARSESNAEYVPVPRDIA